MKDIPDKSIDMILSDLPYNVSSCEWDKQLNLDELWLNFRRIIKDSGNIVLTAKQPFTSFLIVKNLDLFKYTMVWLKNKAIGFYQAKNLPMNYHEDICIFSQKSIGHISLLGDKRMTYNPQGLHKVDKPWKRPRKYSNDHKNVRESHKLERIIEYEGYPTSIIEIGNSDNRERGLHPTQKPVALFEYLIKTFSNQTDVILDCCAGSGTTAIACLNTDRKYICMEKEQKYFDIMNNRIRQHRNLEVFCN